ncbi:NAD(P)/FAD-dependent oxidoreductase [Stygiolobus caldivivus]|uniref:FAD-dependent oxidoreductase n=1 Tax=Stygiolobus caldivivus TaxID=2824673 RepID=A0A8D5ZK16_9CREN|nr:FAD-dependent oxidoreductase [Stygiolobus caldivivus]BCU71251.1 FAD-dependent oxidoreductase [Stygiolobus caldivivus]
MKTIILGGGFAGLSALKVNPDALLIDQKSYFTLTHRLVDVVKTGDPKLAKVPYHKVLVAKVRNVDFRKKLVITDRGDFQYDRLLIALGYSQKIFANTEKVEDVQDALKLREKLLKAKSVVVLGGGNLGVELAGAIKEMDPFKDVYLIEAQDRLLSFMTTESSTYAYELLTKLGVKVLLKNKVEKIDNGLVVTNDHEIRADIIISSVGFKGSPMINEMGLTNVNGRMVVDEYLRSVDYNDVYGAGDCATTKQYIPMSAQVAVQAGKRAMLNLLGGEEKFRYKQVAIVVRIGDSYFGDFLGRFVKGELAELAEKVGIFRAVRLVVS